MSLSRRSSQRRTSRKVGPCPTCGSTRVHPVTEDVVVRVRGRRCRVDAVAHERCQNCGERIFDLEAARRFDAVALGSRRRIA